MICVGLMTNLRHVEEIDDDLRMFEATTGRLKDRLRHLH